MVILVELTSSLVAVLVQPTIHALLLVLVQPAGWGGGGACGGVPMESGVEGFQRASSGAALAGGGSAGCQGRGSSQSISSSRSGADGGAEFAPLTGGGGQLTDESESSKSASSLAGEGGRGVRHTAGGTCTV